MNLKAKAAVSNLKKYYEANGVNIKPEEAASVVNVFDNNNIKLYFGNDENIISYKKDRSIFSSDYEEIALMAMCLMDTKSADTEKRIIISEYEGNHGAYKILQAQKRELKIEQENIESVFYKASFSKINKKINIY